MSIATSKAERSEQLISEMREQRGYLYPEWEFAARQDPDLLAAYNSLYSNSLSGEKVLSVKVREFIAIGILLASGEPEVPILTHMRRAMREGATVDELFQALATVIVPAGAPSFYRGLQCLLKLVDELSEQQPS